MRGARSWVQTVRLHVWSRAARFPALVLALACLAAAPLHAQPPRPPFAALYQDAEPFLAAIRAAEPILPRPVTGITVPHHLVAADLIARGFRVASGARYDKIVLLTPDHFKRSRAPFATTDRAFGTVFGEVRPRAADVAALLRHQGLIERSDLFEKEHGLHALLPFVRHHFPDVEIVPIALALNSTRAQWEELVALLLPLVDERTLIVQSTDFSHFLPQHEAIRHDQTVLNLLAAGDPAAIAGLVQPLHLDSRAAQYVQMRLQQQRFGATPLVLANANSQQYFETRLAETTSYILQVYPAASSPPVAGPDDEPAFRRICFAGDTAFSRHLLPLLADRAAAARMRGELGAVLAGCPLVLNLEGVLVPELPTNLGPLTLAMPAELSLDWLKALNVVAVSLANNHAMDLGAAPFEEMARLLTDAGIKALRHGDIADLGAFRLLALTDIDNSASPQTARIGAHDLDRVARSRASPPLVAFLHWGLEYSSMPAGRERMLADELRRRAVALIVGAHPHRASARAQALAGGEALMVHSLGNFLFDQRAEQVSGSILEVRVFPQGTLFARLLPLPNVYRDVSRAR